MFLCAKNALTYSLRLSLAVSGSYWISPCLSMALCDSHSGSLWLSLPLSGILWPSLAHNCSLISRIQPLIGSHRRCHNDALYPALENMLLLSYSTRCCIQRNYAGNAAKAQPAWCLLKSCKLASLTSRGVCGADEGCTDDHGRVQHERVGGREEVGGRRVQHEEA